MADFYKTNSKYFLKSKNKTLENGDAIYEKDITTFTNTFDLTEPQTFSEGSFIVVTNNQNKKDVIFNTGKYDETVYTLDFLNSLNEKYQDEIEELKLNPDNINFNTFGYFGSLMDVMRSSFFHILDYFPAGLYINIGRTSISGDTYEIPLQNIYNPFGIEYSLTNIEDSEIKNINRYLGSSYLNYVVEKEVNGVKVTTPVTGYTFNSSNNSIVLYTETILGGDLLVRPKDSIIEDFYNSKNGLFYDSLLNRYTNPIYTSKWYTLTEDDTKGLHYELKTFTWPSFDGYNPDMSSGDYVVFFKNIEAIVNITENYTSNNIYRALTHSSLKESDYLTDSKILIDNVGYENFEKILKLYGRNFDFLKNYIDGISSINRITYDKNDNIPDILVETQLRKLGWINNSINYTTDSKEYSSNSLFNGHKKSYTLKETQIELFRRLAINSKHLSKRKGTINGLKAIIKMFGIKDEWFELNEYVGVTEPLNSEQMNNIRILNEQLHSQDEIAQENNSYVGLPIQKLEDGRGIPKINTYYEDQYFQMKGGWNEETTNSSKKNGTWSDYKTQITSDNNIVNTSGNNPHSGNDNYDFGQSYIEVFSNCFSNELKNNEEAYPTNQYKGYGFDIERQINNNKIFEYGELNNRNVNLKNLSLGLNISKIEEDLRLVNLNDENYVISSYFNNTVLPYAYQMIPSTTIMKFYPYTNDDRALSLYVFTNTDVCTFSVEQNTGSVTTTIMDRVKEGNTSLIKINSEITIKIESYDSENYEIDGFYDAITNSSLIEKVNSYTFNDNILSSIAIEIRLRRKFSITVNSNNNELGIVSIYGSNVTNGETGGTFYITKETQGVYVSANTISSGYTFDGWYENDALLTKQPIYQLPTIRSTRNIVGKFVKPVFNVVGKPLLQYTISGITTTEENDTSGYIVGDGIYEYGSIATMKVGPNQGFLLNRILFKKLDGTDYDDGITFPGNRTTPYQFTKTVTDNFIVEVEFLYQAYHVTISSNDSSYGTVSGSGLNSINRGNMVTVNATPSTGYNFVNWTENGISVSTNQSYSFSVYKNSNLVANFEKAKYNVTTSTADGIGGYITGGGTKEYGTTVTIFISPSVGYEIDYLEINGDKIYLENVGSYQFIITENTDVKAMFVSLTGGYDTRYIYKERDFTPIMSSIINNQGWGYSIVTNDSGQTYVRALATTSTVSTTNNITLASTPVLTKKLFTRETSDYLTPEVFNKFKDDYYNFFNTLQTYNKMSNTISLKQDIIVYPNVKNNNTLDVKPFQFATTTTKEVVIARDFNDFLDYLEEMFGLSTTGVKYFDQGLCVPNVLL